VTHIMHFNVYPNSTGGIANDCDDCSMSATCSYGVISRAHAAGKKVLFTVGGWMTDTDFYNSTSDTYRATFIHTLMNFLRTRGYDGIDIDWEPLQDSQIDRYETFINQLYDSLGTINPRPMLTAATGTTTYDGYINLYVPMYARLKDKFDQINLMTYDMSGPWGGWVVWHNAPTTSGGFHFPSTGALIPSADAMVDEFVSQGVPIGKLSIGIDWYGYVWSGGDGTATGGVTEPRQQWTTAPSMQANVPYYDIMSTYYQQSRYRWDDAAGAAYLTIDNTGSANDKFISYDNQQTGQAKVQYMRDKGIGGLIIWELGGGYRTELPAGQRDSLLQSIKTAFFADIAAPATPALESPTNGATGISTNPSLTWIASSGGMWYRVQVSLSSVFDPTTADSSGITSTLYSVSGLRNNTTYYWRVNASNSGGTSPYSTVWSFTTQPMTDVKPIIDRYPTTYYLSQNFPNPFNPTTSIEFSLPKSDYVSLVIFNVLGSAVHTLLSQKMMSGAYRVQWDASGVPSGVYFYRLMAGSFVETKKIIVMH
jgi:GH18 family chitinase